MTRPGMSWRVDGMIIRIFDHDVQVMQFFLGEAIESVDRELIEEHIRVIERTPWIRKWHDGRQLEGQT